MKNTICRAVLVLAAIVVVGCGKGDDKGGDEADKAKSGAVVGSCDQRGVKGMGFQTCTEYTGSNWTAKEVEQQCMGDKKFIAATCPAEGTVVSCRMYAGKASELVTHYYDQADKAKQACERMEGVLQ